MKRLLIVGLLVAVVLAAGVSLFASSAPDGLERVAAENGIVAAPQEAGAWVLADYTVAGSQGTVPTAVAGLIGVVVTAAVGFGFFHLLRGRRS